MVGAPGAGKSTWCANFLRERPDEGWRVINGDVIRLAYCREKGISYNDAHQREHLEEVGRRFGVALREVAASGAPLILDVINGRKESRAKLVHDIEAMAEEATGRAGPHYPVREAVCFLVSKEEAIARKAQAGRERVARGEEVMPVPDAIVERFVDDVNANLPRTGAEEGFTRCVFHATDAYRAAYPNLAAELGRGPAAAGGRGV